MAFRNKICVIAVCDLCGNARDQDGGEPHFDTEADAIDFVVADSDPETGGWYQRPAGQLVCWRRDRQHDQAREEDGQVAVPGTRRPDRPVRRPGPGGSEPAIRHGARREQLERPLTTLARLRITPPRRARGRPHHQGAGSWH